MKALSRLLRFSSSAADDVAAMSLTCAPNPQDCGTFAEPPPFRKTRSGVYAKRVEFSRWRSAFPACRRLRRQNQIFNTYIVWAQDTANLSMFGWHMPVTWLLAYAGVSTAFLAIAVFVWRWLANKGISPLDLTKIAVGCAISVLGPPRLALARSPLMDFAHKARRMGE